MSLPITNPSAAFCVICGVFLPNRVVGRMAQICPSLFCREWELSNSVAELHKARELNLVKRRNELEALVCERAQQLQPKLSEEVSLKIVVLPFLPHNLKPPSIERMHTVETGFLEIALAAYASEDRLQPQSETGNGEPKTDQSHPDRTLLEQAIDERRDRRFASMSGSACGTCGGQCCNQGGDHAFLDNKKFLEIFRGRPEATPEGIVAEYMDRIPEESFENSCIFHRIDGCSLSREQRSGICNRYLCPSLLSLRDGVRADSSRFLFAATNLRDLDDPEPKVFRIKLADDEEISVLESAPNDRKPVGAVGE